MRDHDGLAILVIVEINKILHSVIMTLSWQPTPP